MFDCADGKRVIVPEYGCGQQHAGSRCLQTVPCLFVCARTLCFFGTAAELVQVFPGKTLGVQVRNLQALSPQANCGHS